MGVPQYFLGPMAKPHRMALLTGAYVLSVFENDVGLGGGQVMALALVLMVVGVLVTCTRRTLRIVADLKKR